MTKLIQHRNILPPARRGSRRDAFVEEGSVYNADVVVGESIRIFGKKRNGQEIIGKRVWSGAGFWSQDHGDWIETVQDNPELIAFLVARDEGDPNYAPGMVGDWCIEHGAPPGLPFSSLQWVNTYTPKFVDFDKTFRIGDYVVEGAYHHSYSRPIAKITGKTVTVTMYSGDERRVPLHEFCWCNWNFDLAGVSPISRP